MSWYTKRVVVFNNFLPPKYRKPRLKQYMLLIVLVPNFNSKLVAISQLNVHNSLLEKLLVSFCTAAVGNACAKFKVDCLSRFCIEFCNVFTPQKPFPSEIPWKLQHQILFNAFSDQITNASTVIQTSSIIQATSIKTHHDSINMNQDSLISTPATQNITQAITNADVLPTSIENTKSKSNIENESNTICRESTEHDQPNENQRQELEVFRCRMQLYWKRDSGTGVFQWILWNF